MREEGSGAQQQLQARGTAKHLWAGGFKETMSLVKP